MITVRELGPIVKLFASLALVEGGTDVLLDFVSFDPKRPGSRVAFSVHRQNGGPWALKGVASLPDDLEAALAAALRPARI